MANSALDYLDNLLGRKNENENEKPPASAGGSSALEYLDGLIENRNKQTAPSAPTNTGRIYPASEIIPQPKVNLEPNQYTTRVGYTDTASSNYSREDILRMLADAKVAQEQEQQREAAYNNYGRYITSESQIPEPTKLTAEEAAQASGVGNLTRGQLNAYAEERQKRQENYNAAVAAQEYTDSLKYNVEEGQKRVDELRAQKTEVDEGANSASIAKLEKTNPELYKTIQFIAKENDWTPQEAYQQYLIKSKYGYKSYDELEKAYTTEAKRLKNARDNQLVLRLYNGALGAEDFDKYSKSGAADKENTVNLKATWDKSKLEQAERSSYANTDAEEWGPYTTLTPEELGVYNYWYAKEKAGEVPKGTAQSYIDSLEDEMNRRYASGRAQRIGDNLMLRVREAISTGFEQFQQGIYRKFAPSQDYYAPTVKQYTSEAIKANLGDFERFLYDAGVTIANMAPSIGVSMLVSRISPTLGRVVGAATMGASASGNAYAEAINLGMTPRQASAYSNIIGASETTLQTLLGGIPGVGGVLSGKLLEKGGEALARFAAGANNAIAKFALIASGGLKLFGNMVGEGVEEFTQDVLEPYFRSFITGEAPDDVDWEQALYSGLMGAMSSLVLGGGEAAVNKAVALRQAKTLRDNGAVGFLIEIADAMEYDTKAYKLAQEMDADASLNKVAELVRAVAEVNADAADLAFEYRVPDDKEVSEIAKRTAESEVEAEEAQTEALERVATAMVAPTTAETSEISAVSPAENDSEGNFTSAELNARNAEITAPRADTARSWEIIGKDFGENGQRAFTEAYNPEFTSGELDTVGRVFTAFYNAGKNNAGVFSVPESVRASVNSIYANPNDATAMEAAAYTAGINDARLTTDARNDIIVSQETEGGNTYGRQGRELRVPRISVGESVQSTREQSGRVSGATGENQEGRVDSRRGAESSRNGEQNARRVQEVQAGQKVSPKQLGLKYGTDKQNTVVTPSNETLKTANKLGVKVIAVKDALEMRRDDGKTFRVNGASFVDPETGEHTIVVQSDNPKYAERQILLHEATHEELRQGRVDRQEIHDSINELANNEEEVWELFNAYAREYGETYTEKQILDEIFCDAKAAMDRWGIKGAKKAMDSIRRAAGEVYEASRMAAVDKAVSEGKPISYNDEVDFSRAHDAEYMEAAREYNAKHGTTIPVNVLSNAAAARKTVLDYMNAHEAELLLPEDIEGKNWFGNNSYGGTLESTTVCTRSLAAQAFMDMVSEQLGRPLTVKETLFLSQDMMNYTSDPECVYCYVAADRRAYREFLGEYIKQRDAALKDIKSGVNKQEAYERFLGTRKDTKNMRSRFNMWLNTTDLITAKDLASLQKLTFEKNYLAGLRNKTEAQKGRYNQLKDAMAYAQSASWAKKMVGFTAYNGEILTWTQKRIDELNSHYGARMYSFSDFSPAFILENMQQVTDAAVRGLKMFSYNKAIDFVKIFAPTGMNFNVSVFGYEQNGQVAEDAMQGVPWKEAQELRAEYPGVGVVFVATNDTLVDWAKQQDWIDVVIPYHTVRTGKVVADFFGYKDYKQVQEDGKIPGVKYEKGAKKSVYPAEHQNDIVKYVKALDKYNLTPRFPEQITGWREFLDGEMTEQEFRDANPYYMKFVNETRRAPQDTPAVQPVFDTDAAITALEKMAKQGGYNPAFGGSIETMNELADEFTENIRRRNAEENASFSREEDDEYLRLAEDPEANKAELQRMVDKAAKEAGYDIRAYHGTQNVGAPFTVFKPSKNKSGFGDYKFGDYDVNYFTTSKAAADSFAQADWAKTGNIYSVFLKTDTPYIVQNSTESDTKSSFNIKDESLRDLQLKLFDEIVPKIFVGDYDSLSLSEFNNLVRPFGLKVEKTNDSRYKYELRTLPNNSAYSTSVYIEEGNSFSDLFYDEDGLRERLGDKDDYYFSTDDVVALVIASNEHAGTNYDSVVIPDIIDAASMLAALRGPATDIITLKTPSQIKSADPVTYDDNGNVIPLSERFNSESEDIRFSEDNDLAYHAGDLGKSESLGQQSGSRGTGHFGTGTYFVGNREALKGYNSRNGVEAPVESVDFSKYNLYKPANYKEGIALHEFLKGVNEYFDRPENRVKSAAEYERTKEEFEDLIQGDFENANEFEEAMRLAESLIGTYRVNELISKQIKDSGFVTDAALLDIMDGNDKSLSADEIFSQISDIDALLRDLYKDVNEWRYASAAANYESFVNSIPQAAKLLGISAEEAESIIAQVSDEIAKENLRYPATYTADSASTRFMKALGYEGVDVRGIEGLDNTKYGSVIYDLKGDDLARKQEIGTARFSPEEGVNADLAAEFKALQRENAALRERLAAAKGQLKRTEQPTVRSDDVRKVARSVIKRYDSNANTDYVAQKMEDLGNLIVRGSDEKGDATYTRIKEAASDIMYDIIAGSDSVYDADVIESHKRIRDTLRTTKLYVSPSERADAALGSDSYENFRKKNFGTLNLTSDPKALRVDVFYQELVDQYPWMFDRDITSQGDMLREMVDAANAPLTPSYNIAEEAEVEADDLLWRLMGEEVRQVETFADKAARKQAQAVAHESNKLNAARDKIAALKEEVAAEKAKKEALRKQKNRIIEEIKRKHSAEREDARERKERREAEDRLLGMLRRVNNTKLSTPNRAWFEKYFGDIYTVAKHLTGNKLATAEDLQKKYAELKENDPDFIGSQRLEEDLAAILDKQKDVASMTDEEIGDYTYVLMEFLHQVQEGNKMTRIADRTDVRMQAYNVMSNVIATKGVPAFGVVKQIQDATVTSALDALRAVRRYTGYNDSDPLYLRTRELAEGQRAADMYTTQAKAAFSNLLSNKKFVRFFTGPHAAEIEIHGTDANTNESVTLKITPALRTGLYLNNQNDDNRRHITYGGVIIPDIELLKKGKISEAFARGTRVKFTPKEMTAITSGMTKEELDFARLTNSYFSEASPRAISEVYEELHGVPPKMVGAGYYPLKVADGWTRGNADTIDINAMAFDSPNDIGSPGWLKERKESISPIYLFPADMVVNRSINDHGRYVGLAIPADNFNKLWEAKLYKKETRYNKLKGLDETYFAPDRALKDVIAGKWGTRAKKNINSFFNQILGRESRMMDTRFGRFRSRYARSVLELNPSVALKQMPSGIAAAAVVGYAPLAKAVNPALKIDTSFIDKMTASYLIRREGYSQQELGELAQRGKKLPPALSWIIGADLATTGMLKRAAAFYVRDNMKELEVGSDAYKKAVVEVYDNIISETQPTYDVIYRANVLRSTSEIVRALNMFRTQPFKNFNILYDALGNLQAKRKAYHEANRWVAEDEQSQRYAKEAKAAYHDAKKRAVWAFTSQAASGMLISLIMAGWDMLRGKKKKYADEDGEVTFWSFLKGLGLNFASTGAGMIPYGGVLLDGVETLVDAVTGDDIFDTTMYGFSVPEVDLLNDTFSGVIDLGKALYKAFSAEEGADWKKIGRAIYEATEHISQFMGVPLGNARKAVEVMARQVFKAEGKYVGEYMASRFINGDPLDRKGESYTLLYKAKQSDTEQYNTLYEQMVKDGFKEDDIRNAMNKKIAADKGLKSTTELSNKDRYLSPSQQKTYDSVTRRVKSSEVWAESDSANRAKLSEIAYDVIAGSKRNTWKSESITTENDLTQTEYILYKLALDIVDKPNSNGNYGTYTDSEKAAAVKKAKQG